MALRVVFMGTPVFSEQALRQINSAGHEILAVYTQPPRPSGRRGLSLIPSPVHKTATDLGLEVRTPLSLRNKNEQKSFAELNADVGVVVAYGLILPSEILKTTFFGFYNAHASLLPRWRGAAPIARAIMAGDKETGVMIMKMDEGLDTGSIALTRHISIEPDITASELQEQMKTVAAYLMLSALSKLETGNLELCPQEKNGITYANKIDKAETQVDWSQPAKEVHNHIRALSPFPGAWCKIGPEGKRLKLLRSTLSSDAGAAGTLLDDQFTVACGNASVRLLEVQKEGSKPLSAIEFLRGTKHKKGSMIFSQ